MPELDVADAEGMGRGDTILVCVPLPDGPALTAALRERGFAVAEAELSALVDRLREEAPRVLIVDVDQPVALEAVERAREVHGAELPTLLCVGEVSRAAELGASRAEGHAFERPLDLEALVLSVLALAEPASQRARPTVPPSFSRARETVPPPFPAHRPDSEAPPPSDYPSIDEPLEAALLPTLDEDEGAAFSAPIELSPELLQILASAEQRMSALGPPHPSSIPSPEEELDLLLPADMLASLDEPIDAEDYDALGGISTGGSGGTGGTSYPRPRTSGQTGTTGPGTGVHLDPGTGVGEGTRSSWSAPDGGSTHTTGAPPAVSLPESAPPEPLEAEPSLLLSRRARAGIGVVPIPVESLPDRPVPAPAHDGGFAPKPSAHDGGFAPKPPGPVSARGWTFGASSAPPSAAGPPSAVPQHETAVEEAARRPPVIELPVSLPLPPPPVTLGAHHPAPRPSPPTAPPPVPEEVLVPAVLGPGDAVRALAACIASRASGSLALGPDTAVRRIVLHEGDIVTAASGSPDETLLAFLVARGDIEREVASRLSGKLPAQGRHAGAALIAHGHLGQDDLWPVLRAHAEWILGRVLVCDEGTCALEAEPPGRLRAEPNVFGGATGAEVLLEEIRRVVPPAEAARRLGGATARLAEGPRRQLLAECALRAEDEQVVRAVAGRSVGEVLADAEPELADVLYGLVSLGVLEALAPVAPTRPAPAAPDPLDEEALRQRVRARVALVEDGDYFSLLGVPASATSYEIRRAYLELRRAFEPARVLTAATADLSSDVRLVVEVLDEAYEILREPHRRERYRRALEAGPP